MTLPHAGAKNPTVKQLKAQVKALQKNSETNGSYTRTLLAEATRKDERIKELETALDQGRVLRIEAANHIINLNQQHAEVLQRHQSNLNDYQTRLEKFGTERQEAIRERNDWETKAKLFEKQFFQIEANSRSMLMSMVYSLDMVTAAQTHGEKRVIIEHMRRTFEKLANKPIGLKLEDDNYIPF